MEFEFIELLAPERLDWADFEEACLSIGIDLAVMITAAGEPVSDNVVEEEEADLDRRIGAGARFERDGLRAITVVAVEADGGGVGSSHSAGAIQPEFGGGWGEREIKAGDDSG